MVIKPHGFAIWEKMQQQLDKMFKDTGHVNAYFPLFIPKSFLSKEAEHVDGFAKECAVVTHHRLMNAPDGSGLIVDPDAKLEEELIVRPTSETIIWNTYKDWIQSYRDLPLLINQWANVVRWELRTRLFLRTTEFLWQEGHTAHATRQEAVDETRLILDIYATFAEEYMAMPVIKGVKTANERFAGADDTYCIEALMQDGKALQAGTSHFLGQNFAKAFDVTFLNKENQQELMWATSWGVSTRLVGGLIMTHSDDDGLVLPPKLASAHAVILPIIRKPDDRSIVMPFVEQLASELREQTYHRRPLNIEIDDRDIGGARGWDWIKKGIPIRIEIGPRDIVENSVFVGRRDRHYKEKESINRGTFIAEFTKTLDDIQTTLFNRAAAFREANTHTIGQRDLFYDYFTPKNLEKPEIHGGFAISPWCGDEACELKIKDDLSVTIRCIPFDGAPVNGACICCGKPATQEVVFAKAY